MEDEAYEYILSVQKQLPLITDLSQYFTNVEEISAPQEGEIIEDPFILDEDTWRVENSQEFKDAVDAHWEKALRQMEARGFSILRMLEKAYNAGYRQGRDDGYC